MHHSVRFGIALMLFNVTGCAVDGPSSPPLYVTLVGIAPEAHAAADQFGFGDFRNVRVEGNSLEIPLPAHAIVDATQAVKLLVRKSGRQQYAVYDVIFGPNFASGDTAVGWVEDGPPTFRLASRGWTLTYGTSILTKTDWVAGGAEGSTLVLHKVNDDLQRVYFLQGTKATITSSAEVYTMNDTGTYVNITKDSSGWCRFDPAMTDPPYHIADAPADIQTFINRVKKAATAVGWAP